MPETTSRRVAILVAVLAVAAYAPSLDGGFVADDLRFVVENEAIRELGPARAVSFFTDPSTQAAGSREIYRPLRTLDFAIDHAIAGDSATFYRVHSLLYHVLGSLLVLALLSRLLPARAAAAGALLFALHPVNAESIAYVSSRGDLICLVFFVGALLLHLRGRTALAAVCLAGALLGKEIAAVFPAAAFLLDRLSRRERPPWRAYGAYAGVVGAYTVLWLSILTGSFGQVREWPGGSYGSNVITVAKGFLYYAKSLVFPVDLVYDWHVPARRAISAVDWLFVATLLALAGGLLAAGRTSRFVVLWIAVTLLPVSGLLWPMAIPTTERFLLLPSVGFCLGAGALLGRTRLRYVVIACFFALTLSRGLDWRTEETLWTSVDARADTPIGLAVRTRRAYERALATRDPADAEATVAAAEAFVRLYREDLHVFAPGDGGEVVVPSTLGGEVLTEKAIALLLLERWPEALSAAEIAIRLADAPLAWQAAGAALEQQGRIFDAVRYHRSAMERGLDGPRSRRRLAGLLVSAGRALEERGEPAAAADAYRRALDTAPDEASARPAREALERLLR